MLHNASIVTHAFFLSPARHPCKACPNINKIQLVQNIARSLPPNLWAITSLWLLPSGFVVLRSFTSVFSKWTFKTFKALIQMYEHLNATHLILETLLLLDGLQNKWIKTEWEQWIHTMSSVTESIFGFICIHAQCVIDTLKNNCIWHMHKLQCFSIVVTSFF